MDYGATENITEVAYSSRQYVRRFDSIELKYVTKVLEIKNQKVSSFFKLSHQVNFDLLMFFLLLFGNNLRPDFGFHFNFNVS